MPSLSWIIVFTFSIETLGSSLRATVFTVRVLKICIPPRRRRAKCREYFSRSVFGHLPVVYQRGWVAVGRRDAFFLLAFFLSFQIARLDLKSGCVFFQIFVKTPNGNHIDHSWTTESKRPTQHSRSAFIIIQLRLAIGQQIQTRSSHYKEPGCHYYRHIPSSRAFQHVLCGGEQVSPLFPSAQVYISPSPMP